LRPAAPSCLRTGVNIRGVFADADTVIVLWDGSGTTINETTYKNSYAWFMRVRDGKVIDGTAFYDSISFNQLCVRTGVRFVR